MDANWDENQRQVRNVLVQILFLNLIVAAVKVVLGIVTGALSIFSDGIHSTMDGVSNVIGLFGIKYAAQPSDKQHPYGHKKVEFIATLGIVALLIVTSIEILEGAVRRFNTPTAPEITGLTFGLMIFTVVVNLLVTWYEYRQGIRLKSLILVADSTHTKSDVMVSLGVIAGMYGISRGYPIIDPILSLLILGIIMRAAIDLFKGASRGLLDEAAVDPAEIQKVAAKVPGVKYMHHIRTRGPDNYVFLDACAHVDPSISVRRGHMISHRLRKKIHEKFPQIRDFVIHIEPVDREASTHAHEYHQEK